MKLVTAARRAFVLKAFGTALTFLYTVLLARMLPTADFGAVMWVLAALNAAGPIALVGIDRTSMKFAAIYRSTGDDAALRGLRRYGLAFVLGVTIVLALAALAAAAVGLLDLQSPTGMPLLAAALLLPFWALLLLDRALLRGLAALRKALLGFHVLRSLLPLVLTIVAARFVALSASVALVLYGAGMVIAVLINALFVRERLPRSAIPARYEPRAWLRNALPLVFSAAVAALMARVDVLAVGAALSMAAAGMYGASQRLAALTGFVLDAVRIVISPMISKMHHAGEHEQLQKHISNAANITFVATLIVAAPLMLAPGFFLGLFGEQYVAAAPILVILTIGQVINALAGPSGAILWMTDYQKEHAIISAASLAVYAILLGLLIPALGLLGAATATASALAFMNTLQVLIIHKRMSIVSFATPRSLGRAVRGALNRS